MSNDAAYAGGLLNRALNPATQPPPIREFLREERERLRRNVRSGQRVVDFGCGTGRHLVELASRLALGVGLDYQRAYIASAVAAKIPGAVYFIVADATQVPCAPSFDVAICMTNTWGTMSDKAAVLREMRRLAPASGRRLLSVYSATSIGARREWYARLGHAVTRETDEYLETAEGFRSEHFTVERLRSLIGQCEIEPIGEVGYLVLA